MLETIDMNNDYSSNAEQVINKECLVQSSKARWFCVGGNDAYNWSKEVDKSIGPPDLQNVSESHLYMNKFWRLYLVVRSDTYIIYLLRPQESSNSCENCETWSSLIDELINKQIILIVFLDSFNYRDSFPGIRDAISNGLH